MSLWRRVYKHIRSNPLILVAFLLVVTSSCSAIAWFYHSAREVWRPTRHYREYALVDETSNDSSLILSLEYPVSIPPAPLTDDNSLVLRLWVGKVTTPTKTMVEAPWCSSPPWPTLPSNIDADASDIWFLLWSPNHNVTIVSDDGSTGSFNAYIHMSTDPQYLTKDSVYSLNLYRSNVSSSEQLGLCFAAMDGTGHDITLAPLAAQAAPSSAIPTSSNFIPLHSRGTFLYFCDQLFNYLTPDCIKIPAILSFIGVLLTFWDKERQRRAERYKNLSKQVYEVISSSPTITPRWEALWTLFQESQTYPELHHALRTYIRKGAQHGTVPWLYEARQWLNQELSRSKDSHQLLETMQSLGIVPSDFREAWDNWQQSYNELRTTDLAKAALVIAKGLGLESISHLTDSWLHLSTQQREEISRYWSHNTLGRYLISSLDRKLLLQNPEGILKPLPAPRGPCRLWPKKSSYAEKNPFGPLKAEEDSRLIDNALFCTPKFWDDIGRKQHNLYLFPKGGGLSAALLRACYESGPYGPKGLTVFAATLSLEQAITDESKWLSALHQAIANSILCALVADPIWLLLMDDRQAQREIVALLSQAPQTDGLTGLIEALRLRGLSFDNQSGNSTSSEAGQLLLELIASIHSTGLPAVSWDLLYSTVSNIQWYLPWYKVHQDDQDRETHKEHQDAPKPQDTHNCQNSQEDQEKQKHQDDQDREMHKEHQDTSKPQDTHNCQNSQEDHKKQEHQPVPFFFWIELSPTMTLNDIHHIWQDRHLRNLGFIKLFLGSHLEHDQRRGLLQLIPESVDIQWDKDMLKKMIGHRMNQFNMGEDKQDEFWQWFEDHGYTLGYGEGQEIRTPQALIEIGNLWWNTQRKA